MRCAVITDCRSVLYPVPFWILTFALCAKQSKGIIAPLFAKSAIQVTDLIQKEIH
jgi:hypothetical protein